MLRKKAKENATDNIDGKNIYTSPNTLSWVKNQLVEFKWYCAKYVILSKKPISRIKNIRDNQMNWIEKIQPEEKKAK